jgi:hypothetical protein
MKQELPDMSIRNKAVVGVAIAATAVLALAGCGSGGGPSTVVRTSPPIDRTIANHLASMSQKVADDLDAGETCSAAIAADELASAVGDADLPSYLRASVNETATRLVNEVNCPPPPPPAPEPKKKPKDEHKGPPEKGPGGNYGNAEINHLPPGHAKKVEH